MTIDDFKKIKIEMMKAHDKDGVTALNTLISKLMLVTIEKRAQNQELSESDVVSILQKTERELIEEREGFVKAGRTETVSSLDAQIAAIKKYIPAMMTAEQIKAIILTLDDKTVPAVMKKFKQDYAGKCDMRLVGEVLKSL